MHRGGGWVEHDGESIAQVEVMLFRAYTAIETQIYAGDSGLLVGQDPLRALHRVHTGGPRHGVLPVDSG